MIARSRAWERVEKGAHYNTLRPAISICVFNGSLYPEVTDGYLAFLLQNVRTGLVFTDKLQIHLIELPKYNLNRGSIADATPLEKWVYFFRFAAKLTPQEIAGRLTDPEFAQAAGVLEMIARTPRERELYDASIKMERDVIAKVEYAKTEGWEKGLEVGRAEGIEVGLEKGLEKGLQKGREEGRIQILQQLLGLPESSSNELVAMSLEQLSELAIRLQSQRRDRH